MQEIIVYSKNYCPFCKRAIALLDIKDADYKVIDATEERKLKQEMQQRSGRTTVPQICIGSNLIGGCDDLFSLYEQGGLAPLLVQLSV